MTKERVLVSVLFSLFVSLSLPLAVLTQEPVRDTVKKAAEVNDAEVVRRVRERIRREQEKPKATVRGRVTYAETGMPMRYTEIGFFSAASTTRTVYQTTTTDENGEYVFKGLREGTYYPDVRNAGVIRPSSFPPKRFATVGADGVAPPTRDQYFPKLTVQGNGVFNYDVAVRRAAAISGVISYFDGEPASDLQVQVSQEVNGVFMPLPGYGRNSPFRTKTDDLGYYRLSGLLPGKYKIFVTEPVRHGNRGRSSFRFTSRFGKNPFQTFYAAGENKTDGDILEVFSGQFIEDINITLPERRLYDLSGLIIEKSTGEPLRGFRVDFRPVIDESKAKDGSFQTQLLMFSGDVVRSRRGSTDNLPAEWELRNLLPGKYVVTASQVLPYRSEEKDEKQVRYPSVSQEIEITDTNINGIRIEIPLGGSLKFEVIADGKKVARSVMLWMKNVETGIEKPMSINVKNEDGRLIADAGKLPSGEYKLNVTARGFYTTSFEGSGISGDVIEIEDGDEINDVKVYLSSQLGTVKGRVTGIESGQEAGIFPVVEGENFWTTLMKSDSRSSQGTVGKDGKYSLRLAPGEYSLVVITRQEIERNPTGLFQLVEERAKSAQKVTVSPNEIVNTDLRMQ